MGTVDSWASLSDQRQLADELFGSNGRGLLSEWLRAQTDPVDADDFAREFAEHLNLPGIAAADYAHRIVDTTHGDLLGGIRFYGRDSARPFVDVLAHNFDDIDALKRCVAQEWSNFGVRYLRTIDRHNHSSRSTACRAGRPRVLDDIFLITQDADE